MEYFPPDEQDYDARIKGYSLSLRGNLAIIFVERWGMVAGKTGTEDSSGRAYISDMTPDEVVARAIEMSEKLVAALEEKDWVRSILKVDVPATPA